jgi:hypothetical protein
MFNSFNTPIGSQRRGRGRGRGSSSVGRAGLNSSILSSLNNETKFADLQSQVTEMSQLLKTLVHGGSVPPPTTPGPSAPQKLHSSHTPYIPRSSFNIGTAESLTSKMVGKDQGAKQVLANLSILQKSYLADLKASPLARLPGIEPSADLSLSSADASNYHTWSKNLYTYIQLLHEPLVPVMETIATVDRSLQWEPHTKPLAVPTTFPPMVIAMAQAALTGSVSNEFKYLIHDAGTMDFFDCYAKLTRHFAPNSVKNQGRHTAKFWQLALQPEQNVKQFANTIMTAANNINRSTNSSQIKDNDMLAALLVGLSQPSVTSEFSAIYKSAIEQLEFKELNFVNTVEFISQHSQELPTQGISLHSHANTSF